MDKHEAERRQARGEQILEGLGNVPAAYAFACELPAVHDEPLSGLDRVWADRFEAGDRDWMVILNGQDRPAMIESLGVALEAGAAFVVCDDALIAKVTPLGPEWFQDPDTGELVDGDFDIAWLEGELLRALHTRLTQKGKDLPPIQEVVSGSN